MESEKADKLERNHGVIGIEFPVEGLFAFVDPQDKKRVAVAGAGGITILTALQALSLADGLREIAETYLEAK